MQYFIGIPVPNDTREKIISFQKSFVKDKIDRIVEPHVTVKSQSGLTEDKLWMPAVEKVVKEYPSFEISLEDVGNFGDDVIFLIPSAEDDLFRFHQLLMKTIKPNIELREKYFEGDKYHPHLTLMRASWGMTSEELMVVKNRARTELLNFPPFKVSFVRIYEKESSDGVYEKLRDIPLKT